MQHEYNKSVDGPVTEMAIVNTFTKLIFGDEVNTSRERMIIQAFRLVDANVARDSQQEMGQYLRSLGVREMIQLVARLRQHLNVSEELPDAKRERGAPAAGLGQPGYTRGVR
jgi:hypothetical protein